MEILSNQLFLSCLPVIAGLVGACFRQFLKMAASLQEISITLNYMKDIQRDTETRLRIVEKHTKLRG